MIRYVIKRLIWMIPIVLGITIFIFTLMYFVPGDPAKMILGVGASPEEVAAKQEALGLNDPYLVRLGNYVSGLFFHGDMGTSYVTNTKISGDIMERLPRTFGLGIVSMIISFAFGLLFGIIAALNQNRWPDHLSMLVALLCISIPAFWLALMLVLLFSVKLNWLPASGMGGIKYYILPAIANSFGGIAGIARQTRSSVLEVIRSDYVTTARSKGLTNNEVTYKHILPNALIPIITMAGGHFGTLLGGSIIIETVFSINGMGTYMMSGISNRDYPVVQSCVVMLGVIFSLCMLLVDLAYAFVDPRIKAQYESSSAKRKRA